MSSRQLDEEEIFHIARTMDNPAIRSKYLGQICAGDQALRERVEALLEVHEQEQEFLKSSPEPASTAEHTPLTECPGTAIGRYKLMEQIGEGGMGTVFVAEQERPIRRKVALKVIKPGMDSKAVVARFEAERQALAMMDHPCIAKVLDAGTTVSGRPYFAMELVKGIPITEYCDKNKLTIRDRLDLFVQVCQAIQHAHQKGIIHRDIKPSNVLVTLHDGKPVPKVIDFGVAKALNTRLTDKTIYTEHLQIVGTLLYMSPEQAELSGLDIDTRSDVYSLGVLLYELLTGTTPFQKDELNEAAFDEQRRIIREQDPPRASVRISSLGETATTVAEHRQTDAKKLHQLVRGDLDWIVAKALEKDRTRRYETASSFAADVGRFLRDDPIEARPPSTTYRIRKLISRHRVALATTIVVLLALICGTVASTSFAILMKRARDDAETANQKAQATLTELRDALLERGFLLAFTGDIDGVKEVIEAGKLAGLSEDWQLALEGAAHLFRADVKKAIELLENAAVDEANVSAIGLLGTALIQGLEYSKYEQLYARIQNAQPRAEYRDYDEFLLAYVQGDRDFAQAADRMESVLQRRPSWILPRALVSDSRLVAAQQSGDWRQLEAALQQTESLQTLFPNNQFVARCHFASLLSALEYHGRREPNSVPDLHAQAFEAAESLSDYQLADRLRPHFFDIVGETDKARAAWIDATRHGSPLIALDAMGFLHRAGYDADAREIGRTCHQDTAEIKVAQAYMLVDSAEQRGRAISLAISAVNDCPTWWIRQMASKVHLLLGDTEGGREMCSEWIKSEPHSDLQCPWIWLDRQSIRFLAGDIGREEYEKDDTTMWGKFYYHYTMGCLAIGQGDRSQALKHLELCVADSSFISPESNWARAFHLRLQADPEWPRGHRLRLERQPLHEQSDGSSGD